MQAGIRLGLAALVIIAAIIGLRSIGDQTILVENVMASSHGGGLVGVTMDIRNTGEPDRLVSVASPEAEMALVKSVAVAGAPIPARGTVSLVAEGAHVMLGKLSGSAEEGRMIPLVLSFEVAGEVAAKAHFGAAMAGHGAMSNGDMAMMGMDYAVPEGEPAPGLSLTALKQVVGKGKSWTIILTTTNFRFSQEAADGPHEPGVGHAHLYVGGVKIGRVYDGTATVPPLPPGKHLVRVTLNTNNHQTYVVGGEPVTATVVVGE